MHEWYQTLEELRRDLPLEIDKQLVQGSREPTPRGRFQTDSQILRTIVVRLADHLNSLYCNWAQEDTRLEREILKCAGANRGKPTTGHYTAGVDCFVRYMDSDQIALFKTLWRGELPEECTRFVSASIIIKEARQEFEIPVSRLERYIARNLPESAPATNVANLIEAWKALRNAEAHSGEAGNHWWSTDQDFYRLLNSYLRPAVYRFLLHPPVRRWLADYEGPVGEKGAVCGGSSQRC